MSLESLGLDITVLAAVVALTETIKKFDKKNLLKEYYVYIPLLIAALGALLVTKPLTEWRQLILNVVLYTGVAGYGYDFIKKTLNKVLKK